MGPRKRRSRFIPVFLGACLAISTGGSWADECRASLDSMLMHEEKESETITYTFKVDVRSPERCADVDYVLKVVESASGEEDRNEEISRRTRVRDGASVSAKVDHRMPRDNTLVSWKFEVVRCTPCGAAKP